MSHQSKIALFGATGQVGSAIRLLRADVEVIKVRMDQPPEEMIRELSLLNPVTIINAAAFTNVDAAENLPQKTLAVNSAAVMTLVKFCQDNNCKFIHFSSDYVFSGDSHQAADENAGCSPKNVYGWSKLLADQVILNSKINATIIRPSWVMSPTHQNFVTKILALGLERDSLEVVADQIGRPTSANLLARVVIELLEKKPSPPLMHVCDSGEPTNWFEIARYAIKTAQQMGYIGISSSDIEPVTSERYPTTAQRPRNSLLDCSLFDRSIRLPRAHWKDTVYKIVENASHEWA